MLAKRSRRGVLLLLSVTALSLAASGCVGGFKQDAVIVEPNAFITLIDKQRVKRAALTRKDDQTKSDVVNNVEIPAGYVCVPPSVLE